MNIWLVKLEEDLPIDEGFYHWRMTMIADGLLAAGHKVVRWASDYNHKAGRHRFGRRQSVKISPNYQIELLRNPFPYPNSRSPLRLLSVYWQSFVMLIAFFRAKQKPDAIIVAMPMTAVCAMVAFFARRFGIPFFLDARDMHPDILLEEMSGIKKILAYPAYMLGVLELRYAVRRAYGLLGITDLFVDWILKYRKTPRSARDASFPIGFQEVARKFDDAAERDFWRAHGVTFQPDEKLIYFAGTLNTTVSIEAPCVARAMQVLADKGSKLRLVYCGAGSLQDEIRAVFAGLDNVVMPGHVNAVHLAYLKQKSSIALLSIAPRKDYQNSLANKFFDYASGAMPLVTCLNGEAKRVLAEYKAGFFYSNAEELADILSRLEKDNSLRNEIATNARKMFETCFVAEKVYAALAKHIEKSLSP